MKRVGIEALLQWAYRDELPKAAAGGGRWMAPMRSGWGGIERYAELFALVQEPNRFGLIPDIAAGVDPHPDALVVHEAVRRLDACDFAIPDGWDPLSDMGDLGVEGAAAVARGLAGMTVVDRAGRQVLRRPPSGLVIRQAILGGAPAWEGEVPVLRQVTGANGRVRWFRRMVMTVEGAFGPVSEEIEMEGYDVKRQRPMPDAYAKFRLDPDPVPVIEARAEYEIWRAALDLLAEDLVGALATTAVTPCTRSRRPWEAPDPERRILPSLLTIPANRAWPRAMAKNKKRDAA